MLKRSLVCLKFLHIIKSNWHAAATRAFRWPEKLTTTTKAIYHPVVVDAACKSVCITYGVWLEIQLDGMDGWSDGWTDGWWDRWMKWCFTSRRPLLYVIASTTTTTYNLALEEPMPVIMVLLGHSVAHFQQLLELVMTTCLLPVLLGPRIGSNFWKFCFSELVSH
jgi:hypothetical protein